MSYLNNFQFSIFNFQKIFNDSIFNENLKIGKESKIRD